MIKKILLSAMLMLTCVGIAKAEGEGQTQQLTIFSPLSPNDYSSYVPLYGYDANRYQKCEIIYPADSLNDLIGKSISQMDFYLQTKASAEWNATMSLPQVSERHIKPQTTSHKFQAMSGSPSSVGSVVASRMRKACISRMAKRS